MCIVDSGASLQLTKMDFSPEELTTANVSGLPTTVIIANGSIKEAMAYVKDLDLFVTVQLLEDTPAVLHLGKL